MNYGINILSIVSAVMAVLTVMAFVVSNIINYLLIKRPEKNKYSNYLLDRLKVN